MSDNLSQILDYVKEHRAIDFNAYRPDTIKRRLDLRINSVGAPDYNSLSLLPERKSTRDRRSYRHAHYKGEPFFQKPLCL